MKYERRLVGPSNLLATLAKYGIPVSEDYQPSGMEIWFVDEGDIWKVMCMDCGIRLGTVNAGYEAGALTLTGNHNRRIHRE